MQELQDSPFLVRHSRSFVSLLTNPANAYRYQRDEALRQSPADARSMRRDGWIRRLLRERVEPVALSKWHLEAEDDGDPRQTQAVELITKILKRVPRFARLRMKLRECNWFGVYGAQLVTSKQHIAGVPRTCVTNWLPVHGDKLVPRHDGTPGILIYSADASRYREQGYTVEPTERGYVLFLDRQSLRDKFVIDTFDIDDADYYEPELAGSIFGTGLRGEIQWLWWLQAELIASVMDFLGKIGSGGVTVIKYEEGNPESRARAERAAKDLETGNVILAPTPKGTSQDTSLIERIEANTAGAQFIIDIATSYYDAKIERCIIGQSASSRSDTGNKLGSQNTDLQGDTKYNIIRSDATNQDETITDDLVTPLLRWNIPGTQFKLRFCSDIEEPGTKDWLDSAKTFVDMGGEVIEDEVRQRLGLGKPQEGDKTLSMQQQQQNALAMGGMPGMPGQEGMQDGMGGADIPGGADGGPGGADVAFGGGGDSAMEVGEGPPGEQADPSMGMGDQSSPEIQAFFENAVENGQLFTPAGLKQLKRQLNSGGWKWGINTGLVAPGTQPMVQYAREKAQWRSYRNPETGQSGWISAKGRVVYEDPGNSPDDHPHGRKSGDTSQGQNSGQNAQPQSQPTSPGDKVRRHVGVQRGVRGGLEGVSQTLSGMLDNPESVTPQSMTALVDSLMGLTVQELNQLRQQYGGKRGRKGEMVQGLSRRLQDEGLPGPQTFTQADKEEAMGQVAKSDDFNRRMGETYEPPAYRDPTSLEQSTGQQDPQMRYKDIAHHGTLGRTPQTPLSVNDRFKALKAKMPKAVEGGPKAVPKASPTASPKELAAQIKAFKERLQPPDAETMAMLGRLGFKPEQVGGTPEFKAAEKAIVPEPAPQRNPAKDRLDILKGELARTFENPAMGWNSEYRTRLRAQISELEGTNEPAVSQPALPGNGGGPGGAAVPRTALDRIRAAQKGIQAQARPQPVAPPKPNEPLTPEPPVSPAAPRLTPREQAAHDVLSKNPNQNRAAQALGITRERVRQLANSIKAKLGQGAQGQSAAQDVTQEANNRLLERKEATDPTAARATLPQVSANYDKNIARKAGGARQRAADNAEIELDALIAQMEKNRGTAAGPGASEGQWDDALRLLQAAQGVVRQEPGRTARGGRR